MVNDDLGAIAREAERAGFAAAVTESNVFWSVITTNANMSDTTPIFDAGEGNLVTAWLSLPTPWRMRANTSARRRPKIRVTLNLQPRYLFVAPNLERTAEKLVRPPDQSRTTTFTDVLSNAYASQLELYVEADSRRATGCSRATSGRSTRASLLAPRSTRRLCRARWRLRLDGSQVSRLRHVRRGAIDRRGTYYQDAALMHVEVRKAFDTRASTMARRSVACHGRARRRAWRNFCARRGDRHGDADDPTRLSTPESGQPLTLRQMGLPAVLLSD